MDRDWRMLGHFELLVHIAKKVDGNSALRSMRLVCKHWMEAASLAVLSRTGGNETFLSEGKEKQSLWLTYIQRFPNLTAVTYNSTALIDRQEEVEGLLQLGCLEHLSVCIGLPATETLFPQLSTLTRLKSLNLHVKLVLGQELVIWKYPTNDAHSSLHALSPHIGGLLGLQDLTISYEPISDSHLQPFSALCSLRALTLKGCLFDPGTTFVHLPASLTRLLVDGGMHQSYGFTDSHLANLGRGRLRLASLSITDARHLTGKGLRGLLELPGLRSLDLKISAFGGEHLSVLRALTGLTSLEITSSQTLTQEAIIHIAAIASLEKLRLINGLFTGIPIGHEQLLKLTSLEIYMAALGLGHDRELEFIQQLPALDSLSMSSCKYLTTGDLLGLRYAQRLRFLNLSCLGEGATDALMESVCCLRGLTKLILCSSPWLTEAGLVHISSLTSLVSLDLCSCNALRSEMVVLAIILPRNLKVLDLSYCAWLTNTGLWHMSMFEGPEELLLTGCQHISAQGINHLFNNKLRLSKINVASCKLDLSSEPWFDNALSSCEFVGARGYSAQ